MTDIEKNKKNGRIKYMMRILRKWWALKVFIDEAKRQDVLKLSATEISLGNHHQIAEEAIIGQIVRGSLQRFSWIIKDKAKREKKLSSFYSSIFQEAKRERLVYQIPDNEAEKDGVILNPPGRPFIVSTDLGDKYISEFWYKILKAIFFNVYATGIIITIVITISSYYIKKIFRDVNAPPIINVYPDITLPEMKPTISPIINVYPNK